MANLRVILCRNKTTPPAEGNPRRRRMKKLLVPLAVLLLLALAVPAAFAEVELGMGWTPFSNPNAAPANDPSKNDSITAFHVGYSWTILYGTWDALALPAWIVANKTDGAFDVPGFLNLYDIGIRLVVRPFLIYAEGGVNSLYIYGGENWGQVGANLRLGAGLKFGFWGVNLSATSFFASLDDLGTTLKALGSVQTRNWAISQITDGLLPSLNVTIYF
jgi:hypothetical protein